MGDVTDISTPRARRAREVPEHLIGVENMFVEVDGDGVYGAMLKALMDSGQAFNFATITDEEHVYAYEGATGSPGKIGFAIDGIGYATEISESVPGRQRYTVDDTVLYRITAHSKSNSDVLICMIELADNPFRAYADLEARIAQLRDDVESQGQPDPEDLTAEQQASIERVVIAGMIGEFLTGIAMQVAGKGMEAVTPALFINVGLEAIRATEDETDRIKAELAEGRALAEKITTEVFEIARRRIEGR